MSQPAIPWPITPSKKLTSSKCHVLIEQELPEDSSDEEYQPNDEDQEQVLGVLLQNTLTHLCCMQVSQDEVSVLY
jgi:hypothetical protein